MARTPSTYASQLGIPFFHTVACWLPYQLRRHNKRNDVFVFRFYSLSFVAFIHYNDNVFAFNQPQPCNERSLASATNFAELLFILFFHPFLYRIEWCFYLGSRARTLRTAVACLCVQSRVLATAARLSNFPSHARVIQFIYCLSTRQRNWIRVNRLNSYCFIIFIQKLSIMLPTESLVVQSFVRSFAAHNQLLDTRSFKASAS